MVKAELAEKPVRRKKGEKAQKKKMAIMTRIRFHTLQPPQMFPRFWERLDLFLRITACCTNDTDQMQKKPRHYKCNVANHHKQQPKKALYNMSFIHLACTGNYQTKHRSYPWIPFGLC